MRIPSNLLSRILHAWYALPYLASDIQFQQEVESKLVILCKETYNVRQRHAWLQTAIHSRASAAQSCSNYEVCALDIVEIT